MKLIVLTSHDTVGETGDRTTSWLANLAVPYLRFEQAGLNITLASPPFFPLDGFSKLLSGRLSRVADRLDTAPMTVTLARLLQRPPNNLLIPGTSSTEHPRKNIAGAARPLSNEDVAELETIGQP